MRTSQVLRKIGVIALLVVVSTYTPQITRFHTQQATELNSSSTPVSFQNFCRAKSESSSFRLEMSGQILLAGYREFQNLLQTSDLNSGLRIEVSNDGGSELIVTKNDGSLFGLRGRKKLVPGQIHEIELSLTSFSILRYSIDGLSSSATVPLLANFKCDRIVFGQGYDASRRISGYVSNATAQVSGRTPYVANSYVVDVTTGILLGSYLSSVRRRVRSVKQQGQSYP